MITDAFRLELQRIETKIDTKLDIILQLLTGRIDQSPPRPDTPTSSEIALIRSMTPRQHIVAQLLVMGWLNRDISELMDIGENTVKLHVRAVCKKADVKTRGQAAMIYKSIMDRVDPSEYMMLAGGLPVDWAISLQNGEPDPYRPLYEPRREPRRGDAVI